jgi:hypothetical protein
MKGGRNHHGDAEKKDQAINSILFSCVSVAIFRFYRLSKRQIYLSNWYIRCPNDRRFGGAPRHAGPRVKRTRAGMTRRTALAWRAETASLSGRV